MNLKEFLLHVSHIWSSLHLEQFATILWSIWTERNKERHGTKPKPREVILYYAISYLEEFHVARNFCLVVSSNLAGESQTEYAQDATWLNPPTSRLKLNTDVVVNAANQTSGFGAILRNSAGKIVAAMSAPFRGCFSPVVMEALALMHSLQWLIDLQLPVHLIETDSLLIVNYFPHKS
uniref:RNase H type-1 domain-containing protein n=1 Tax=Cannabis sativa TaxID=3483 RepID=A0A803PHL9_CANSA